MVCNNDMVRMHTQTVMGVATDLYLMLFVEKFAVFTITLEDCMH